MAIDPLKFRGPVVDRPSVVFPSNGGNFFLNQAEGVPHQQVTVHYSPVLDQKPQKLRFPAQFHK